MTLAISHLQPLACFQHWRHDIRAIATDMDGTLTRDGEFSAELLADFERLDAAGIAVLITTGRSAGWVSGLACYLPVAGLMAENGGIFYPGPRINRLAYALQVDGLSYRARNPKGWPLKTFSSSIERHRKTLAQVFYRLCQEFPQLEESSDNIFRQTDWTFDIGDLTEEEIEQIHDRCHEERCGFTYSQGKRILVGRL